jgi:hypothetical protein
MVRALNRLLSISQFARNTMIPFSYICTNFGSFSTITNLINFGQKTYARIYRGKMLSGDCARGIVLEGVGFQGGGKRHMFQLLGMCADALHGLCYIFGLTGLI